MNDDDRGMTNRGVDVEQRVVTKPARTSAAAAFALAIGVAALLCVLTVVLSPVGLILSIIGLVLGFIGIRASKKLGITGRGVAIAGVVLSALALIGSIAFAAGAVTVLNNQNAVDRIEQELDKLRDKLPENVEVPQP
ncbi:MAG: DUF4190 domain-containing protein [Rhodococcus sp. (in: high G+C Gram-positive bacteria)]